MRAMIMAAVVAGTIVPWSPVAAGEDRASDASARLERAGLDFEAARRLAGEERKEAVAAVVEALDAVVGTKDLPAHRRSAAYFLAGEASLAHGAPDVAGEHFRKAERAAKDDALKAAAVFAEIRSLEAEGLDVEAADKWADWLRRNPEGSQRGEALLASAWNAARRGTLEEAGQLLARIREEALWMTPDPRFSLAEATVHYLAGRPADALAALGDRASTAEELYLHALARRDLGDALPAAARFQEVVERHPESALRDPALLAKADIFLSSRAWKSAAEEFDRVAVAAHREDVRAEAELRAAASVFLDGNVEEGIARLRQVVSGRAGSSQAGRAQYLLGEVLFSQSDFEGAIVEFHRVLADYFDATLAARAQYRIGRSLDALDRSGEATSAYQAVVAGYTQEAEAPAAAYLAGVGMLESGRPLAAAPYFQIVMDRYAVEREGTVVFAEPEHQELVEASLCLLQLSYHRAGDLGQLSGVPHLLLGKMPRSSSPWRAFALLIDADALASLSRYDEARSTLEALLEDFPQAEVAVPATRLLAWTYSRQGETELAIAAESRILDRYQDAGDEDGLAAATLHRAHILFNEKAYREAAAGYDSFVQRFPSDARIGVALYQAGLSHQRAGSTGDAADRWEALVAADPASDVARKAWARAADLYFQAEHYEEAKRCFLGLLENFGGTDVEPHARLRIAQCEYNRGADAEALEEFAAVARAFPGSPYAQAAEQGMEQALYRLGQSDRGEQVLAELVERFPTGGFAADALYEIAMRRYEAKDYGAAADAFRRVVTQFPSHASADRAQHLMADAYERDGRSEDALRAYEQFLYFFPSSALRAAVRFRLGTLRFESGDYLRAAVDFTTVLEEEIATETAGAARYNLALCHIQLGNVEEGMAAAEQFRRSQGASDGRSADLSYRIGELHERSGRPAAAVPAYQAALEDGADRVLSVELNYRLGSCLEASDPEAALEHYRRAVKIARVEHPYYLSAVARVAALHEDRGEYDDAVVAYRKLIRHSPDAELVAAARERVEQLASLGT